MQDGNTFQPQVSPFSEPRSLTDGSAQQVVRPGFCSRAPPCPYCGRNPGFIFGIEGFGLRDRGHEERCLKRLRARNAGTRAVSLRDEMQQLRRSNTVKLPAAQSESLGWLNALVGRLWPKIDEAAQKIMHEQVAPKVNEALPAFLQGQFAFDKFTLGRVPLKLGPIESLEKPWGIQLTVGINLDSSCDIEVSLGAKVGIEALKISGKLVIQLGPIIGEMPVVGGVVVYFLDPPKVDLKFTDLGKIVDMPGLAGIVRSTIDSVVASACVLPNVISVPLGKPEQGVDLSLLSQPKPMGILRVTALRATGLKGLDHNLLGNATSDPYVKVRIADQSWRSSTARATCDPVWTAADTHDFVVYDRDQAVHVDVYDEDSVTKDDFLGRAKSLHVTDALGLSETLLPLTMEGEESEAASSSNRWTLRSSRSSAAAAAANSCGTAQLRFEWLEVDATTERGPDGCVVVLEVEELQIPPALASDASSAGVVLSVTVAGEERQSRAQKAVAPHKATCKAAGQAVDAALRDIVARCGEAKMDVKTISKISALPEETVQELLNPEAAARAASTASDDADASTPAVGAVVEMKRVFYAPVASVQAPEVTSLPSVELKVYDAKGKQVLGSARLSSADGEDWRSVALAPAGNGASGAARGADTAIVAKLRVCLQGLKLAAEGLEQPEGPGSSEPAASGA
eukprot:TRINITY_DN1793_c0_g1_i1.p1 TRINITY_DN1793_c0_g1~~TRINITY_DN1793_c0_g1_i1.p1  ORF type:complete len:723 (-),score=177.51 TRINITY_DN1793_c0_g1_i1:485-2536(-)